MTPSRYWRALPMNVRLIVLLLGFIFIYYSIFAKHHYFDREANAIRNDVQNLIRNANKTGFMKKLFIEAKLPDIFQEDSEPLKGVSDKRRKAKENKRKGGELKWKESERESNPQKGENSDERAKDIKKSKNVLKERNAEEGTEKEGSNEQSEEKAKQSEDDEGDGMKKPDVNVHKEKPEENVKVDGASVADKSSSNSLEGSKSHSDDTSKKGVKADAKGQSQDDPESPADGNDSNPSETSKDKSKQDNKEVASAEKSGDVKAADQKEKSTSDTPLEEPHPDGNKSGTEEQSSKKKSTEGSSNQPQKENFDDEDYAKEFADLDPLELSEDTLPLLVWNYNALYDETISEQVFGLGNRLDHVSEYKTLCIDSTTDKAIAFEGRSLCGGFNRTVGWFLQYCNSMKSTAEKEYLLRLEDGRKPRSWLTENAEDIRWVEGLTIIQVLEKNCGNIAHYAGRILLLQHILDNIESYSIPPRNPANILILPTFHIMKRFYNPHNYGFWHKFLLNAIISPHRFKFGTLGNFLEREAKSRPKGSPLIQLLHNFSTNGSATESKRYVCFKRAIVPSFFKGRFFVNDPEVPSKKPSFQSKLKGAPHIPRDSLRLRERVSALIDKTVEFEERSNEIVLLDRGGSRRAFDDESRTKVLDMIKKVAEEKGYQFTIADFEGMTFDKQYHIMKKVAVAIGIHGANLVNTMFMPPLSVLLEIFPFGFRHEMYKNGGNAGLKYMSYMMKQGKPFEGTKVFRSIDQCIRLDPKCKVHYRDAALQVTDEDMVQMERLLREAINWCNDLPKSESKRRSKRRIS